MFILELFGKFFGKYCFD